MQPDNIGRPSACRFQRGEALISSCSDQAMVITGNGMSG